VIRILDRYVLREVTLTWVGVTGVLLVILVTNQLARVLERAAEQQFPREVVLALIGFSSLQNLTILIPVALLLAVVLAFGRLYHESEMAAIQACGVGLGRLYLPVLSLTIVLAVFLAWLSLSLAPGAAQRVQELRASALREAQFGNLEPGRFRTIGGSGAVLYASTQGEDGTLRDVFVKRSRGDRIEVALATRARHFVSEGGALHTLVLENGYRYEGTPGKPEFRITRFREHGIPVRLTDARARAQDLELLPTAQLLRMPDSEAMAEVQWRLSMPIMAFVLTFIAMPLSRLRPRQGRYARVGLAILIYFLYSNLLSAAKVWVARDAVPREIGLWWVHLLLIGLGVLVIKRRALWQWLRRTRGPAPAAA
jgi:lipopolysaccharide export system permease protein